MKRRIRILTLLGLGLTAGLTLPGKAEARGFHQRGQTYVYNGYQGYYTGGASAYPCGQPAPYVAPVAYSPPGVAHPAYYAPRPAYAAPQTQAQAVPQR